MASLAGVSVERLETRVLMAATASLSQRGRLTITSDDAADLVEVTFANGRRNVQVFVNNVIVDPRPNSGSPQSVRRTRIRRVIADMGGGDDEVYIGRRKTEERVFRVKLFARCVLSGGDGNDVLEAGPLDDILLGGPGDDVLFGSRADDVLFGGSGNDQLFGEAGRDNLFGQDGGDLLDGGGNEDALYGMAGADNLVGGVDDDFLNPDPGPGDTQDNNEKPDAGETDRVTEYVDKLINLGVPERFRDEARR